MTPTAAAGSGGNGGGSAAATTPSRQQQQRAFLGGGDAEDLAFFDCDPAALFALPAAMLGAQPASASFEGIAAGSASAHSSAIQDRAEQQLLRQDERRLLLMVELFHLCERSLHDELLQRKEQLSQQQPPQQQHTDPEPSSSSSSSSAAAAYALCRSYPRFEHGAVLWSAYAMLRACRVCGAFAPLFQHACLNGSSPALHLLCDDCLSRGTAEAVNATADSVAAAVARMPGFHGSVVTGLWQLPVTQAALHQMQVPATATVTTAAAAASSSSAAASSIAQSGARRDGGAATTTTTTSTPAAIISASAQSASSAAALHRDLPAAVRYLLSTLVGPIGPRGVVQGVSGTFCEACVFASVLPTGLELVALSTTCNQRESDCEHAKRLFRDRPRLQFAIEGRSFDDNSLMFLTHLPFRGNVTHLRLTNCDRITSLGFKLVATCFPALRVLDVRGSGNIDLDVFADRLAASLPPSEQHQIPNVLANLVELDSSVASTPTAATTASARNRVVHSAHSLLSAHRNPLTVSLETLDLSAAALQMEKRVGVIGQLRALRHLSLAGCECIHDEGFIALLQGAVFAWACDEEVLLPDFFESHRPWHPPVPFGTAAPTPTQQPQFEVNFHFAPLSFAEAQERVEQYRQRVVVAAPAFAEQIAAAVAANPLLENIVRHRVNINRSSRTGHQRMVPDFRWVSSLNLSGVKFLTDKALRWLCGTWMSAEAFGQELQQLSETVSLEDPVRVGAIAAARQQVLNQQQQQQQQPQQPQQQAQTAPPKPASRSELIGEFAARVSLVKPRANAAAAAASTMRGATATSAVQHHQEMIDQMLLADSATESVAASTARAANSAFNTARSSRSALASPTAASGMPLLAAAVSNASFSMTPTASGAGGVAAIAGEAAVTPRAVDGDQAATPTTLRTVPGERHNSVTYDRVARFMQRREVGEDDEDYEDGDGVDGSGDDCAPIASASQNDGDDDDDDGDGSEEIRHRNDTSVFQAALHVPAARTTASSTTSSPRSKQQNQRVRPLRLPASFLAGSLTSLSLAACPGFTAGGYRLVVTSFPALTALDLSDNGAACDDSVLSFITEQTLPQLRELHVKRCGVSVAATCAMLRRVGRTLEVLSCSPFVGDDHAAAAAAASVPPLVPAASITPTSQSAAARAPPPQQRASATPRASPSSSPTSPFHRADGDLNDDDDDDGSISSSHPQRRQTQQHTQRRKEELDRLEAQAELDEQLRRETLAAMLRDAVRGSGSSSSVRHLGLPDAAFALSIIKLLSGRRPLGSSAVSPAASSSSALGALRVVAVPTVSKLAAEEAMQALPELSREGRLLPAETMARMSAAAVQTFIREATHQVERDLVWQFIF